MLNNELIFQPPIIAHRGASAFAPENTLVAFYKAKLMGVNWVEFDVMLTADDEVVVIHDEKLNRTTNGSGYVINHTLLDLQKLDAGSWFDPTFKGEKIPTLIEVIDLLNQLKLSANIEIKAQQGKEELTVKKVLSIILEQWKNNHSKPLISSFSLQILEYVRKYSSTSLLGFLMDEWDEEWKKICDRLNCTAVNVNYKILTLERVQSIKSTKRKLLAYTVNTAKLAKQLFSWGIDGIFSDCPEKILRSLVTPVPVK